MDPTGAADECPARVLAVWCPDWPVVAALQAVDSSSAPDGAGLQSAGQPNSYAAVVFANRVVACSAAARAEGVRRGQRRREAQSRVPDLEVFAHDPARDARAFEPVVAAVEELVPGVEIVRPGLAVVGVKGATRYFGSEARVGRAVAGAVRDTGHQARLGVADGTFAAVQAAYQTAYRRPVQDEPGVIVAPGTTRDFLAPLPVGVLEDAELTDLLIRLGVRTVGDFAALPATDVLARFGRDGLRRHALARGVGERPPTARPAPPELAVATELDPPVERVDAATFAAKALAEELAEHLSRRALACTRIRVEAQTENGEELQRVWRHDDGFTTVAIAERVRWQLDGWLSGTVGGTSARPTAGVTLLRLVPVEIVDAGRQLGLWGDSGERQERVERAVDRVLGLLGPDAVTTAVLAGGRDLADRVRLVPWGESRAPDPADALPWPGRLPAPSPATVRRALSSAPHAGMVAASDMVAGEALAAEVLTASGTPVGVTGRFVGTGEPARLVVAGARPAQIVSWAGPWPGDTRWWEVVAHRRRARFQVVTADDQAWLLVLENGRWWVEAGYD